MPDITTGAGIEVTGLTKVFKNAVKPAVDAINLDVRPGEFMTLLGPSGSGKTTVLNMIAGFEDVTAGRILLDGQDIAQHPPYKRNLGMVFQDYALFPHMTAAQNVAFPLQRRKIGREETARRVAEALEVVRLGSHGDRLPSQLSGGQQQRVALARAIVFRPRALLLDEPLGALDKRLRDSLQLEIARLHSELGITFVFVTHDQEEALALSDRIAVFRDGRIEQVGTPTQLYETPASHFVATFLGDSNVFSGTVRGGVLDTGSSALRCEGPDGPGTLIVRPERMTIGANGSTAHNRLSGTVSGVVYQGAFRRILVDFDGGPRGMVRDGTDAPTVTTGDRVDVSWDVAHSVLVADHDNTVVTT
ncbi:MULTISPECIES: ABC transporter ATP-binding protein [Mycolicibacterium]|jgi:putative spermidine/putrescine transport system ATP-binding protein|uniref:Spermidine/putrescine import ATP-binding protein PotA n=1 Tax=Mycolicibacterium murale TaxID=182220 RepID=A0A7I9WVA8_9MYCO|nr:MULTISPECIES: ABC transporter ATP-binding protein [Mycolicibacterium]ANW63240.1 ABC transporter ATP-binding protein [Mycobacterium sp. djl-10]MCV7181797.1 ABC transporter ATP-binding protein [Mycolicibacterium murale]BBY87117.1 polyamine-transporting ATPase [Mycolicibacterium tokaiense]GFG61621.1 polyamine-transporting ATPase [Mycolicibacterium murale]